MSSRARALGFGAALLLMGSCDAGPLDAPPGLGFAVADTRFGPGDTIRVDLSNNSQYELGYNLCLAELERLAGGRWLVVQKLPEGAACISLLEILRPGESTSGEQLVYPFIDSGVYRFRAQVEWPLGEGRVELISNTFSIVRE